MRPHRWQPARLPHPWHSPGKNSSRPLLNLSCIFSWSPGYLSVIPFWFQDFGSFSLSLFGILYPISSSFVWFDGHLSCSFTCWVFLCIFILFNPCCCIYQHFAFITELCFIVWLDHNLSIFRLMDIWIFPSFWLLWIFWILTPYWSYHLQIFYPILLVVFSFCWWFFCCAEKLLSSSHLFIFAFIS